MPCIPNARDITCLHPKGILTIATVAFVARALQTLALHSDSLPSNTHLGTKSFFSCMANWNAEPVAVSPLLLGNISIHPVPTQFSLGMDKRFLRIYPANSLS